jgi:beta-glucosidase/6-phospho-beta-glucosidase/beta-galactosidase
LTAPLQIIGGFESTYLPGHDRDVAETTAHDRRWADDLALMASTGIRRLRYPIRWHRVEQTPGRYDWSDTDRVLGHLLEVGMQPIVDLVHHTSYPRWLDDGFADARFGGAYLAYAEAVAERYPWIAEYTLFNEPFSTLFLAGHEALWPPYHRGVTGFVDLLRNVLPAVAEASRHYRSALPGARHVFVDTCEHHYAGDAAAERYTAMANDRRFFVTDLFLGRDQGSSRFLPLVLEAGGEDLLAMAPGHIDTLGLDYYAHCQWDFIGDGEGGVVPAANPIPLADQVLEYWDRYRLPCMLSETNIRGFASDRATWLKYTLEQCERAAAAGVPLEGYCWFPFVDSADWDSLLYRCEGNIDPVGVYWLDEALDRRPSSMSAAMALAAAGAPATDLPAYRLREPVASWLGGYLPHMAHWAWQEPPTGERCSSTASPDDRIELRIADAH